MIQLVFQFLTSTPPRGKVLPLSNFFEQLELKLSFNAKFIINFRQAFKSFKSVSPSQVFVLVYKNYREFINLFRDSGNIESIPDYMYIIN
jgi:hypothetical protein